MNTVVIRAAVVLIAIAGVIDPTITTNRIGRANVAVVAADARGDSALANRVADQLSKRFVVTRGAFGGADATILVGDQLPRDERGIPAPAFAVNRERATTTIESVRAPAVAPSASKVPVDGRVRVIGARGKTIELTLRAAGIVVDRVTKTIAADDERLPIVLSFVPPTTGAMPLRVSAQVAGSPPSHADLVLDARDDRFSVLFFDPRPSWTSTFVRRAIERDRRFEVTSRVVTSRNISTDAGQPPARLADLSALDLFDVIVVGAPEALTDADVTGLERFMRRRGGSVVLLLDHRAAGPYDRLMGVDSWAIDSGSRVLAIGDSAGLRATSIAYPQRLADVAQRIGASNGRPVVWRTPVGAGRLVVSGALDAWRFRDRAASGFDPFWQTIVGDAAAAAVPPISTHLSSAVLRPGEQTTLRVLVRDASLSEASTTHATVSATNTVLMPTGVPGEFVGELRAPAESGVHRVVVTADGNRADVPILVGDADRAMSDDRDLVTAWTATRGGRVFAASALGDLASSLADAIRPAARAETWHPMRSPWWIVPFALLASAEWWLRRRRGLR
jgi:hypothetical protein